MKALNKLQHAFAADLWSDKLHHAQGLILDDQLSAARRFNVYRNNFWTSLTDALGSIYPVVEQLVGREFFAFTADRYIRTHPSSSGNLHNLGFALADFLSRFQAAAELPYLSDVARLEWAYHEVFHAAAPQPFEPKILENTAAAHYPRLRLELGPACRLVESIYPIFRIWKVNQEGYAGNESIDLDDGPETVLVVRPQLEVELQRIGPAESGFFKALDAGLDLGEAVDASLKISPEFNLQSTLARHLSSGALEISTN